MQGPLRNELLTLFGADGLRGEVRLLVERLRQRGFVESQLEVLRCLEDLIEDGLVEFSRDEVTDAKIYQASRAALRALHEHEHRIVEESEIDARKTTPFVAPDLDCEVSLVVSEALVEEAAAPDLQSLAKEVLAVPDAGDLCDVAQAFARAMWDLRRAAAGLGEDWNRHPIARMWADKISGRAGTQFEDIQPGDWLSIRTQVQRIAEGGS